MPDDNDNAILARRIEELEALLAEQRVDTHGGDIPSQRTENIPILDDVVTPDDCLDTEKVQPPSPSDEELAELAERLEQKFSMELEETVRMLKENLKDNIARELQLQLSGKNELDGE